MKCSCEHENNLSGYLQDVEILATSLNPTSASKEGLVPRNLFQSKPKWRFTSVEGSL
jgi:hypothetical protein